MIWHDNEPRGTQRKIGGMSVAGDLGEAQEGCLAVGK